MDPNNRPQGRRKFVTDNSKGVHLRGDGLGTGPVGRPDSNPHNTAQHPSFRPQQQRQSAGQRAGGGRGGLIALIIAALVAVGGGGGLLGLFGGGSSNDPPSNEAYSSAYVSTDTGSGVGTLKPPSGGSTQGINTAAVAGARDKRTVIRGDGTDRVTVMVYMCGTDLESRSGMGTNDLSEMTQAALSDNVRVLVYTGGCKKWNNNVVSSAVNQIYEVAGGGLKCRVQDAGTGRMTDPDTLASFIRWCAEHYPANRNELILWDHGGGSVSGYGYDEKNPYSGSMVLGNIEKALKAGGVSFDFIGFDACLMATAETGLMLDDYADYMVASEETEPGIGWYYTDWLTALSRDTAMPTVQLGKRIADDFVEVCGSRCRGQSCTLSVVDLAELSAAAPEPLRKFSDSLSDMIADRDYARISSARSGAREFARSSAIDQIDLCDFAERLDTAEGRSLSDALRSAVKYNRTSADMTRCYGLSIYFPYRKTSGVDNAVSTYRDIGMDDSYTRAIQQFAQLEVSGQAATGGLDTNPLGSLLGSGLGSGSGGGVDAISGLLGSFLGGGGMDFFSAFTDRALSQQDTAQYISDHYFDPSALTWQTTADGRKAIDLPEDQWKLVNDVELNMFYDTGAGFADLGLDYILEWDDAGRLLAPDDRSWLAVNGQPVAFYITNVEGETIDGCIPAYLNGERVELLAHFDAENPRGSIVGARSVYKGGETDTVAKNMIRLEDGDTIDFLCDFYSYAGEYQDTYYLGDTLTVTSGAWPVLSNVDVGGAVRLTYRFTDIYNQHYWTESLRY